MLNWNFILEGEYLTNNLDDLYSFGEVSSVLLSLFNIHMAIKQPCPVLRHV